MIPEPDYSEEETISDDGKEGSIGKEEDLEVEEVTAVQETKRRPVESDDQETQVHKPITTKDYKLNKTTEMSSKVPQKQPEMANLSDKTTSIKARKNPPQNENKTPPKTATASKKTDDQNKTVSKIKTVDTKDSPPKDAVSETSKRTDPILDKEEVISTKPAKKVAKTDNTESAPISNITMTKINGEHTTVSKVVKNRVTSPSDSEKDSLGVSDEGLVVPKKPVNPYLESTERQRLCKELKFTQKYGHSGLNVKSELQIAMDRYQEDKLRKTLDSTKKTSLERILEHQARKIDMQERETIHRRPSWIDRLQEQQDSWIPDDPRTEEFLRVHAKVMSHHNSSSSSGANSSGEDTSPYASCSNIRKKSRLSRFNRDHDHDY